MNRRPRLLATAAVGAAAALLLAACGGGDGGSKDNDKIAGAGTASETSASPSVSATASAARPTIKLPSDLAFTFSPEKTGDATQDAILRDNAEFIRALNSAIDAQDPRLPALEFYTEGEGAVAAEQWVKAFKDAGWTVTGSVRYFDRQVMVKSQEAASLSYCADESKGFSKVIKTQEVKKTKVTKNSYVAYGAQVQRNREGVWELVKIASTRGADRCQP
ncbi:MULTISPECIES: hypothetical protein [Streptomyces]|uniref:Lipoprotein n=1 Tax=Streptomyces dengpaensis TaxID=2049881 RepID=A0ABM6SVM5_9ACTN|nr:MULTISPECIES: hypothetical protein [Streptomyces]AVH58456.1 hypothetical protein C4B68_24790 [Streptomyces dengpaensis]PIB06127.1 hypothetical protein B1C81_26495 [Streptomyces sp. HG99]